MRISDRVPVIPRCLGKVVASVPDEPLRGLLIEALASEEKLARDREWHARLGRPAAEHVSVHDALHAWSLKCTCGGDTAKLLGIRRDDLYASPVLLACTTCESSVEIFDEMVDGWNLEVSRKKPRAKARPASTFALRCPSCKGTAWQPAAVFTYQNLALTPDVAPEDRWQDFFDVMALGGTCTRCEEVSLPAHFKCA
jgi:hypothetical protein